jgi:hypothetical protein
LRRRNAKAAAHYYPADPAGFAMLKVPAKAELSRSVACKISNRGWHTQEDRGCKRLP